MSDELKRLFDGAEGVAPDMRARQQALAAAMAAFEETQKNSEIQSESDQGNAERVRPTEDNVVSIRSKIMHSLNNRWLVSGAASAAVLVVAVSVIFMIPRTEVEQSYDKRVLQPIAGSSSQLEEIVVSASRVEESAKSMDLVGVAPSSPSENFAKKRALPAKPQAEISIAAEQFALGNAATELHDASGSLFYQDEGRDSFEHSELNGIKKVTEEPISTFSADVDTASYSFVRRQLNQGVLPQKDAVRVEEMVNYFDYDYPLPTSRDDPFKASINVIDSPWRAGNKLVHIGIRGYELAPETQPDANLVFLLDVSGSMNSPDKLPLVKQSLGLLLSQLKPTDTVAIAVYAGAAGTILEPTAVSEKRKILAAMDRLSAGGSTAGGEGIKLAYQLAESGFRKDALNRVILATDGDFNVGITDNDELQGFVERQRDKGIFLTLLGFGQGNYHDDRMQTLAQNGNGAAAYIDTLGEAQKVLVHEATSTLFPIAKDVKLQVEFNPATVSEYRLIGYETRLLNREDFNNDKVDAGEIGAGHRVTAIYEITPAGAESGLLGDSRYGEALDKGKEKSNEYGFLKIRYKLPESQSSTLMEYPIPVEGTPNALEQQEVNFATAVAGFGELLKGGRYQKNWDYDQALTLANENKGADQYGYRAEFVQLVRKAKLARDMR